jgi:putative ABC transport system substrate-binding protein
VTDAGHAGHAVLTGMRRRRTSTGSIVRVSRRHFVLAGCALVGVPFRAIAQRANRIPLIGFVLPTSSGPRFHAFIEGMRDLGYADGRNVRIEARFADGRPERLVSLVAELVRLDIDVLVVGATIGARAAKEVTTSIPVVFAGSSDPIAGGIVSNLARPGGNVTGISLAYGDAFSGKWLELLHESIPDIRHFAVLWSSSNPAAAGFVRELHATARRLDVRLDVHHAADDSGLAVALDAIGTSKADGLIVTPSPFAATSQGKLVEFAVNRRLPAMYFAEDFVDAGGLMSYGPSIVDTYRRAASYVDRILRGAKPGDLPVEQPTRFELTINRGTARVLGIDMPKSILLRAGRIIE